MERLIRFIMIMLLFVASEHAAAEVSQLDCVIANPLADNWVYVIDTTRGTASVHYSFG